MSKRVEIRLPDFGEGDDGKGKAVVCFWHVEVGATVSCGEDLLEIVTDKAGFVVPCPVMGILREKCVHEDSSVRVGDVIAIMETI